ncbi:TatD family hydrolase [Thermodesulfobacteriota bacterium]
MTIIEPHIHMFSRTTDDYRNMYASGVRACVEPSFWLGANRTCAGTFFDYFTLILDFETTRSERFGIDHYAAIAVNPKESENIALATEVLDGIERFFEHERCVAVGEIGLNNITKNEISIFTKQLRMAEERGLPVIVHLPHQNKPEGTRIIVDIIKAEGVTQERIIIDHNTEETMPIARQTDCYTGMTVYPYSKLNPQRVSSIIHTFGSEKMTVNSSADWGVSDPLALVKTAEFMRDDGHNEETVQKLVFDNPLAFFSPSPNWKPRFELTPVDVSEYQR